MSLPRSTGHIPSYYNHKPSARGTFHSEPGSPGKPGRSDYVFAPTSPLFEFGHGLSYTSFRYSNLKISPKEINRAGSVEISVKVKNVGKVTGAEVVRLFLRDLYSSVTTPVKALRKFEKVHLRPGENKEVVFTLGPEDTGLWDKNLEFVVEPGMFEVTVGDLVKTFEVK